MKKVSYLQNGAINASGIMDRAMQFVLSKQLKDRTMWEKTVEVFNTHQDEDDAWRGEYFGKLMRGAVWTYRLTMDGELYDVLTDTVKALLNTQDEYGRISSYPAHHEFSGWDMWSRKYVATGLQHYYRICKDEELKARIVEALKKHIDYIISKVGNEEGKMEITATSSWWGCVNSCTILEPVVELYSMTKEARYLHFAEYIISTGGSSDCNFIELATTENLYPYQYPVVKAYETMSFFEGLLAYYEVTGEELYFTAVSRFIEAVAASEITLIGGAGCTHELFDNSAVKQTEWSEQIMQETCVTVTWMRLLSRIYLLTGEKKYIDRIELSAYNALYGALNTRMEIQKELWSNKFVSPMVFDSYSPLYANSRGRGVGGYQEFASGGHNGCCAAIGACGIAMVPLTCVMRGKNQIVVNMLANGTARAYGANNECVSLNIDSNYPVEGKATVTVACDDTCALRLAFRRPGWSKQICVNGVAYEGDYAEVEGRFRNGETITVELFPTLELHRLNGKVAFTYGALTLAVDSEKSDREVVKPVKVDDKLSYQTLPAIGEEQIRLEVALSDGDKLLLTDYQSCGKNYRSEKNIISVWLNEEK